MGDSLELQIIGHIRSPYAEKFGTPRQPGLATSARGRIEFEPEFRQVDAFRGLDGFSHLWVIFDFHLNQREGWKPTVRPPRLGGNERLGVFATRSPFRPNALGLSVVKLEKLVLEGAQAPCLEISGMDLVDGTPVLDIKPYLPYADALPGASGGFATSAPEGTLQFRVDEACREGWEGLSPEQQATIRETLELDPRPAFQRGDREYGLSLAGVELRCLIAGGEVCLVDLA